MVEKRENKNYSYYKEKESIKTLDPSEKESYLKYFEGAYKEDLKHAKNSLFSSPKWSIIAGYYAMHNISKYYLGLNYNLKISTPDIHNATIVAIKELVNHKEVKKLISEIENYSEIEPLYFGLSRAKDERSKTQYYTTKANSLNEISFEKANYFFNNIVEKYIKVIEELIKKC